MSTEHIIFKVLSPVLELARRLDHERELAAATIAQLDERLVERYCRSTAARKFRPCYGAILEILRGGSLSACIDPPAISNELYARLEVLATSPQGGVVAHEDALVSEMVERFRSLDVSIREELSSSKRKGVDHRYQLVVQVPDDFPLELLRCEDIGDLEDLLAEVAGNPGDDEELPHIINGNSFGAGAVEIFLDTNDPAELLELIRQDPRSAPMVESMLVAVREFHGEAFGVVWPPGYEGTFNLV